MSWFVGNSLTQNLHNNMLEFMKIIDKIPLEKGEHFLVLDEHSNKLYVSNNKSDLIQVIDCSNLKEICRISIERPRQLAVNPSKNSILVICGDAGFWLRDNGAKISFIDEPTLGIMNSIGKKEGFGDIIVNPETSTVYATQPKSKKIWVIDGHTMNVLEKIQTKASYHVIASDWHNNRIFLGGNVGRIGEKPAFTQINCANNTLTQIAKKFVFGRHRPKELYHSSHFNLLFCLIDESANSDNDTNKTYIRQIDLNTDSFGSESMKFSMLDRMGFDDKNDRIYYTDSNKGEIQVLDLGLNQIGLFRYAEKKRKRGKTKVCVNPQSNHVYISEEGSGLLYVMNYP